MKVSASTGHSASLNTAEIRKFATALVAAIAGIAANGWLPANQAHWVFLLLPFAAAVGVYVAPNEPSAPTPPAPPAP